MQPHENWRNRGSLSGIVPALIVIGIGVLFLLNNLNIYFFHDIWRFWPAILIALGLVKMVDSPVSSGRITGGVLVTIGGLFLADNLGILTVSLDNFWPLLLVVGGLFMLWHRLTPPQTATANNPTPAHEGDLNEFAMFGGVERTVTTDDFRGGSATALFGGVNIDLRRAGMRGDSAAIDTTAMFGGVEIKIPQNWIAVPQVAAIFGGFDNKATEPSRDMPGVKRLYIKGVAMFGGVSVKN